MRWERMGLKIFIVRPNEFEQSDSEMNLPTLQQGNCVCTNRFDDFHFHVRIVAGIFRQEGC